MWHEEWILHVCLLWELCDSQNRLLRHGRLAWNKAGVGHGQISQCSHYRYYFCWCLLRYFESTLFTYCSSVYKETPSFGSQGLCLKGFLSGFWLNLHGNRDFREHLRTTVISIYGLDLHVFLTGAHHLFEEMVLSEEQPFFLPASLCNRSKCALKILSQCLKQGI